MAPQEFAVLARLSASYSFFARLVSQDFLTPFSREFKSIKFCDPNIKQQNMKVTRCIFGSILLSSLYIKK